MRRLMAMIANRRVDLSSLITHRFALDDIHDAYELFSKQRDGVLKVAVFPAKPSTRRAREEADVDAGEGLWANHVL
jgi:hypothetical protein